MARRRLPLHTRILLGGLLGAAAGIVAHLAFASPADPGGIAPALQRFLEIVTKPIGAIFLNLLFMLVVPLIFSALVLGVVEMGDPRRLGRIGLKTLLYTVVVSAIAVLIGVTLVNVLQPGAGISPELRMRLTAGAADQKAIADSTAAPKPGVDLITQIVPRNPIKSAADGDMLGVMFFSLLFGIALTIVRTEATARMQESIQGLYDVTMWLIGWVISLAPVGVAAMLFNLTAALGHEILQRLALYVGVVVLALAIHQFVVYSLAVRLLGGMSPLAFFRGIEAAMITAFSTASSNATLPTALKVAEENLRLPASVSRFVLTIGSTMNQNGTALFEGVTVLFLAQFYGVHLSLGEQITVVLICILGGIGTAGVPAGSIPVVALILSQVHVPVEGIGLILGVDRFLDMCRTTLNVTGDLAAAVVVSRGEGPDLPAPDPAI